MLNPGGAVVGNEKFNACFYFMFMGPFVTEK